MTGEELVNKAGNIPYGNIAVLGNVSVERVERFWLAAQQVVDQRGNIPDGNCSVIVDVAQNHFGLNGSLGDIFEEPYPLLVVAAVVVVGIVVTLVVV